MHKLLLRQARFIRVLIGILVLAFMSQTFAAATIICQPEANMYSEYSATIMADMTEPVKVAMADKLYCCTPDECEMPTCEMASCALLLLCATTLLDTERLDQAYLIYNEALQSESTMTLLRPPIRY